MKKYLSIVLVSVLMLFLIPFSLFNVSAETVWQGIEFTLDVDKLYGKYYIVSGCSTTASEIVIPATIEDIPVKEIRSHAFDNCHNIRSVIIPDSVTSIGSYAFYDCYHLERIVIPDSVTNIDSHAFDFYGCFTSFYCEAEEKPEGWKMQGDYNTRTHWGCNISEDKVIYKPSDDKTYYIVFEYLGTSSEIVISSTINGKPTKEINSAFDDCDNLTSIVIPDSITSIGSDAFYDCDNLANIIIPDSVTNIGSYAFRDCDNLTNIIIPDSVKIIDEYAFDNCDNLTNVVIGGSVTSIGTRAFFDCDNLTSIVIPKSVKNISHEAFGRCDALESIVVSSGNKVYQSVRNCLIETATKTLILGCKNSVIPNDGSVTNIGLSAFYDCDGLTSIVIPNSVTIIRSHAFYDCDNLTRAVMGDSVSSIESVPFGGCDALESIIVSSGNKVYQSAGNCLIETATKTLKAGCKNSVIPDDGSVTTIGPRAFYDCNNLTSIAIPNSITIIRGSVFEDCDNLTSIIIPDSVTSIGEYAFAHCYSLTNVVIGDSVTDILYNAFEDCGSLTSIVIPDSVKYIGESAFAQCDMDIYFEAIINFEISDKWHRNWRKNFYGNDHEGYTIDVAIAEFEGKIVEIEASINESDYAEEEWAEIQEAVETANRFSTYRKKIGEIRAEIDALENALLFNPKKADFGDIDGDGEIGSLDYLFIKRACFGTYTLSDIEAARADIDRNDKHDSTDYLLVKRITFGTYKVS